MSSVRSKAEEFDIASSLGIEGNENEDIEATVPLSAIPLTRPTNLSRGHDIEDFDDLFSSVEPVEQRDANIANLEDVVGTPSPSTAPRIANAFIDQYRDNIKPVMSLIEKQITRATCMVRATF